VAAGTGERLGRGTAKAFVELAAEPLLVHAARALLASARIDDLVVVAASADCARAAELLALAGLPGATVCAGGATRQDSVGLGLAACPPGTEVVAVHDAARPLVTPALVDRTVAALAEPWAAVAPGLPVVDTLKLTDARGGVVRTVDRHLLWAVQTPQVFARTTLAAAHRGAAGGATDDLALVEAAGGRVRLVLGERRNAKVTYPEDLHLAEAVLAHDRRSGPA